MYDCRQRGAGSAETGRPGGRGAGSGLEAGIAGAEVIGRGRDVGARVGGARRGRGRVPVVASAHIAARVHLDLVIAADVNEREAREERLQEAHEGVPALLIGLACAGLVAGARGDVFGAVDVVVGVARDVLVGVGQVSGEEQHVWNLGAVQGEDAFHRAGAVESLRQKMCQRQQASKQDKSWPKAVILCTCPMSAIAAITNGYCLVAESVVKVRSELLKDVSPTT